MREKLYEFYILYEIRRQIARDSFVLDFVPTTVTEVSQSSKHNQEMNVKAEVERTVRKAGLLSLIFPQTWER